MIRTLFLLLPERTRAALAKATFGSGMMLLGIVIGWVLARVL